MKRQFIDAHWFSRGGNLGTRVPLDGASMLRFIGVPYSGYAQ
jgi:hypothetical protein